MEEKVLYLDIETVTPTDKPNPDKDIPKYIGIRFLSGKKSVFTLEQHEEIQNSINVYRYICGHNIKHYDIPILERFGFRFNGKVILDTKEIISKRAKSMMYLDLTKEQTSLKYLAKLFNLEYQKGEFDYKKLNKPFLSPQEYKEMYEYLIGDLNTGYALFEYLYDLFHGLKELMSPKDRQEMKWLTTTSGSNAYKIICYQAGIPEVYDDTEGKKEIRFEGAYVSKPDRLFAEGNIYSFDFASLYPHMFMGGNLYSPIAEEDLPRDDEDINREMMWNGDNGIFGEGQDAIHGTYSTKQGKIERVIQKLFNERAEAKEELKYTTDENHKKYLKRKILAIKIVINTMYGITGSPKFKSVYNLITASDCTAMARKCIKDTIKTLKYYGYNVYYTDTDSVFVDDVYNDFDRLKRIAEEISEKQRQSFNIYIPTHKLAFENKIKRMWFTIGKNGEYAKKQYMYQKDNDELVVKGFKIVKGDCSAVAQEVFEKYLKPELLNGKQSIFFNVDTLIKYIMDTVKENPDLAKKRYRVKSITQYDNTTSVQAQISMRYGEGEHWLIVNNIVGAGKSKKYGTINELKTLYKDEWYKAIEIKSYLSDLIGFIAPKDRWVLTKDKKPSKSKQHTLI